MGEHFLFGQFLKLSKLFRNFLSNERIVNYGQKLAQRERNFCQITNLFPTWQDKFEAEIKKRKKIVTYFRPRGEVGKWSVVWRKTQFEDNARKQKVSISSSVKAKGERPLYFIHLTTNLSTKTFPETHFRRQCDDAQFSKRHWRRNF